MTDCCNASPALRFGLRLGRGLFLAKNKWAYAADWSVGSRSDLVEQYEKAGGQIERRQLRLFLFTSGTYKHLTLWLENHDAEAL